MSPIEFKEANTRVGEGQPEYRPYSALIFRDTDEGFVVTRWRMTWRERVKALFTGDVWVCVMTFNRGVPPIAMSTEKSAFIVTKP